VLHKRRVLRIYLSLLSSLHWSSSFVFPSSFLGKARHNSGTSPFHDYESLRGREPVAKSVPFVHTPASVYVCMCVCARMYARGIVPCAHRARMRACVRSWVLTCQRTHARGSRLNFQYGHSGPGPTASPGPGSFFSFARCGSSRLPLSFFCRYSSPSSPLCRSYRNALSFFSFIYNAENVEAVSAPVRVFINTHVRRIGIGHSIGSLLFLVTTCLARRLPLCFRFCIAWHHLNALCHAKPEFIFVRFLTGRISFTIFPFSYQILDIKIILSLKYTIIMWQYAT